MRISTSYFSMAFIFLVVAVSNRACKISESPQFNSINNLSITDLGLSNISISSNANFFNPNDIGITLKKVELSLFVNGKPIGSVNQIKSTKIRSRSDFAIPLSISVVQGNLLSAIGGLSGAFGALLGKEMDVEYRGRITISKFWIPFTIPVNYKMKYKL